MARQLAGASSRSSATGAYILCGLPMDLAAEVRASALRHEAGPVPIQTGSHLLVRRDFAVSLRDSATLAVVRDTLRAGVVDTTGLPGSAVLGGVVRGPDGRPFPTASVGVLGSTASTVSGQDGRFVLTGVPAGTHAVLVRAIGFTPVTLVVDIATGGRFDTTVVIDKRPQTLAAVSVTAMPNRAERNGFTERRRTGFGSFITKEDIERWGPVDLVDLVTIKPALRRISTPRGDAIVMRGPVGVCAPSIFLDGWEVSFGGGGGMSDVSGFVQPREIVGVEIYTGPIIPPQFDRMVWTSCGSVVLWTR